MASIETRLDPSLLDRETLRELNALVLDEERPALVGREGVRIDLPDPIFHMLVFALRNLEEGKAVAFLPEDETFTTQAGADFLGMSRPFFVSLLENGKIPFHKVGTHRRVYLRDLLDYQKKRDSVRSKRLTELFRSIDEAGGADADLPSTDES